MTLVEDDVDRRRLSARTCHLLAWTLLLAAGALLLSPWVHGIGGPSWRRLAALGALSGLVGAGLLFGEATKRFR